MFFSSMSTFVFAQIFVAIWHFSFFPLLFFQLRNTFQSDELNLTGMRQENEEEKKTTNSFVLVTLWNYIQLH